MVSDVPIPWSESDPAARINAARLKGRIAFRYAEQAVAVQYNDLEFEKRRECSKLALEAAGDALERLGDVRSYPNALRVHAVQCWGEIQARAAWAQRGHNVQAANALLRASADYALRYPDIASIREALAFAISSSITDPLFAYRRGKADDADEEEDETEPMDHDQVWDVAKPALEKPCADEANTTWRVTIVGCVCSLCPTLTDERAYDAFELILKLQGEWDEACYQHTNMDFACYQAIRTAGDIARRRDGVTTVDAPRQIATRRRGILGRRRSPTIKPGQLLGLRRSTRKSADGAAEETSDNDADERKEFDRDAANSSAACSTSRARAQRWCSSKMAGSGLGWSTGCPAQTRRSSIRSWSSA